MLQLNPNEIIKTSSLISNSLNLIEENLLYFKRKYRNNDSKLEIMKINELEKLTDKISNSTLFLDKIIKELEEATGETLNSLVKFEHSLSFYENKLISHYANSINNNSGKDKIDTIDLCYSKDDKLTNFCQKNNFIEYYQRYFHSFNPNEFGIDADTFEKQLLEIYDKRGPNEAYSIIHALEHNQPSNYHEYKFNPTKQINSNEYYDFNNRIITNYQTNSEIININGYDYEIGQVLPKDCNDVERLAYNFGKANIINTMRTLPDKFLELCSKGNTNIITLTCNRNSMNNNANWSGYYKPSALFGKDNNNITIDIHGSFNDNIFYTQDTLIHELGHKFDDMSKSKSIIDWLFGSITYTKSNNSWTKAYEKYNNVINSMNLGGYTTYPNVNEFFGDSTVAYFKNPQTLKALCPEVYELMNEMLDGEYGYSYNEKILSVVNSY